MSLKFYPLQVANVIRETPDAFTIVFENPDPVAFQYEAGQYLTLKLNVNGEWLRRAYSLSSSPNEKTLSVTIKKVHDGKVSSFLHKELKSGQTIESYPPMGNFQLTNPVNRHIILVGAGSGITPLFSMLKTALQGAPTSKVTLLYGNRDEESIIFRQALAELSQKYAGRLNVIHVLSQPAAQWTGEKGRLTGETAQKLLREAVLSYPELKRSVFLCGPAEMMEAAQKELAALGVDPADVHREYYTAPLPEEAEGEDDGFSYDRVTRKVKVRLDDETFEITVPPNKSILGAVIDNNYDPPYACLEGLCSTCRAKLHSGYVEMDEREGLSDEEVEAGYILTCQSHPLSDNVFVEFA